MTGFEIISQIMAVLLAVAGIYFLISSLDNLFIEILYFAWRVFYEPSFRKKHHLLTEANLAPENQQPIAIMVPLWRESNVIEGMLDYLMTHVNYKNYTIFAGVYPNDVETFEALKHEQKKYPEQIKIISMSHEGPTSKDDCLNSLVQAIHQYEAENGTQFQIFVIHDAEDLVPKDGLLVFNHLIPRHDFVQLPVFPAPTPWYRLIAGHYMDEFAQSHLKEMRLREWLTGSIPSAGVGVAMSRRALAVSKEINNGKYFPTNTVTADYELPLQLYNAGLKSIFFDVNVDADKYHLTKSTFLEHHQHSPATKSLFPDNFFSSVRQKSRWIVGIVFEGWEHLHWRGTLYNRYFLYRDRKALIGHLMTMLGYILFIMVSAFWLIQAINPNTEMTVAKIVPAEGALWYLLYVNLWLMLVQLGVRVITTFELYGFLHAIMSIPRLIVGSLINFVATIRALGLYISYKRQGLDVLPWDKTVGHRLPAKKWARRNRG